MIEARSAELAIIISHPTSASGIIVLLKTPPKYRKLDFNKNKKAQKITHALAISCRAWYNGSYTMMVKPMKTLELHYPVIQFLINTNILLSIIFFKARTILMMNSNAHARVYILPLTYDFLLEEARLFSFERLEHYHH